MSSFDPKIWNQNFTTISPLFEPIKPAYTKIPNTINWPSLDSYNLAIKARPESITNNNEKTIQFVTQNTARNLYFEEQYEPRIFLHGEIQTRLNNWHDFFQVLVWLTWPKTKSLLNQLHYQAASKRTAKLRSPQENFLTLFDECGIIIVSSNRSLLEMIEEFQWRQLFCENKNKFGEEIGGIVFGHAMYEKALNPYIGMTAQALLIEVEPNDFNTHDNYSALDQLVVTAINKLEKITPKMLHPFPLLGVPNWYEPQDEQFYNNQNYFRPGRKS